MWNFGNDTPLMNNQRHAALREAKKILSRRLQYDHVVYPVDRLRLQKTPGNKLLTRAIVHLDSEMHSIMMGREPREGK